MASTTLATAAKDIPRFCLRCQAALSSWRATCQVCHQPFDPADPATYRRQRDFLFWRFWLPGACLAIISGVVSYAIVMQTGQMGMALFVSVPVSFGAILGYSTRASIWFALGLGLAIIPAVVMALVSVNLAGFFCGFTLALIFLVPVLGGVLLGVLLRMALKISRWDQRSFLPVILLATVPYAAEAIENSVPRQRVVATVRTELTVDATPAEAWRAIQFYEEVQHEPPALLRLALPKPISSQGSKARVGDRVRCVYDRGYLCKQLTEVDPGRRLAFVVTEQHLHFERDVRLLDGSFEIVSDGPQRSKIVLTTRYEKRLQPQWLWDATERKVIHSLHGHVLEGMRRQAAADHAHSSDENYAPPLTPAAL